MTSTHAPASGHTRNFQAVEALKQAMVTNTVDALRGAVNKTKKIKGFNPPELKKAEEALEKAEVYLSCVESCV